MSIDPNQLAEIMEDTVAGVTAKRDAAGKAQDWTSYAAHDRTLAVLGNLATDLTSLFAPKPVRRIRLFGMTF